VSILASRRGYGTHHFSYSLTLTEIPFRRFNVTVRTRSLVSFSVANDDEIPQYTATIASRSPQTDF